MSRHNDRMPGDDSQLWQLLRSLDDPQRLEVPADYNHTNARTRFNELAQRLDTDFSCRCHVDGHIEDASFHGRIYIPAPATATGRQLVLVISNFGGLVVLAVDNPSVWDDSETAELLHADDDRRIRNALDDLDYTVIPEDLLSQPYDGASDLARYYRDNDRPQPTWWNRYFDYL
jgi:hypothetical protein